MPNDVVLSNDIVVLIAFACIVVTVTAVLLVIKKIFFPSRQRRTRLRDAVRTVPRADRQNHSAIGAVDHWLERTVYLSGLGMGTGTAVALLVVAVLGTGGITFVLTENPAITIIVGLFTTTVIICWLEISKRRRLQAFEIQFPTALDILSRAVRAGESLEQAIDLVFFIREVHFRVGVFVAGLQKTMPPAGNDLSHPRVVVDPQTKMQRKGVRYSGRIPGAWRGLFIRRAPRLANINNVGVRALLYDRHFDPVRPGGFADKTRALLKLWQQAVDCQVVR